MVLINIKDGTDGRKYDFTGLWSVTKEMNRSAIIDAYTFIKIICYNLLLFYIGLFINILINSDIILGRKRSILFADFCSGF